MIESGRAKHAYDCTQMKEGSTEYRSYVKKMPMMIKVNGLAQTIVFYESKSHDHRDVVKHVESWLRKEEVRERLSLPDKVSLMEAVCKMETEQYRLVTYEIMELLGWMRRFVDAHAKTKEDQT